MADSAKQVGAVISGHFSCWNFGFAAGGWGGMLVAGSPLGISGAALTIVIGLVTLLCQVQDPNFSSGVLWVAIWFAVAIVYFALVGRNKLILSPEEEFALEHQATA